MMAYTGRLRPKGVPLSVFRYMKGYRRVFTSRSRSIWKGREICHLGLWEDPKGLTDEFYGFKKSKKRSIFVIDCYLKDSAFTAVKRDAKFLTRYVKGVPFVNRRYTRVVPFSWKKVYKRVRGWIVSLAAVFSIVTQRSSPRCVTILKTAARETRGWTSWQSLPV